MAIILSVNHVFQRLRTAQTPCWTPKRKPRRCPARAEGGRGICDGVRHVRQGSPRTPQQGPARAEGRRGSENDVPHAPRVVADSVTGSGACARGRNGNCDGVRRARGDVLVPKMRSRAREEPPRTPRWGPAQAGGRGKECSDVPRREIQPARTTASVPTREPSPRKPK